MHQIRIIRASNLIISNSPKIPKSSRIWGKFQKISSIFKCFRNFQRFSKILQRSWKMQSHYECCFVFNLISNDFLLNHKPQEFVHFVKCCKIFRKFQRISTILLNLWKNSKIPDFQNVGISQNLWNICNDQYRPYWFNRFHSSIDCMKYLFWNQILCGP